MDTMNKTTEWIAQWTDCTSCGSHVGKSVPAGEPAHIVTADCGCVARLSSPAYVRRMNRYYHRLAAYQAQQTGRAVTVQTYTPPTVKR